MTLHFTSRDHSVRARIKALHDRHALLDAQLHDEERRAAPDAARVRSLKRRKLRLKDEIAHHTRAALGGAPIQQGA